MLLCALTLVQMAISQAIFYNPNDERFKSLYLEKVQSDYRVQKQSFIRQQKLYEKGLISEQEFRQSENAFKNAQVTYQQAVLSLAFEQPHISIDRAVKYQSQGGKKKVRLTLRNATAGIVEGKSVDIEDFHGVRTDRISNVYISLLNDRHAIVSQPYEAKVERLSTNEAVVLDFLMLQDLDEVIVKCIYGDKSDEKKIFLQKDESANRILITSEQFSQEADLGTRANYDLTLESFSNTSNIYKLECLNLPVQITYDFIEALSSARLSLVKFTQQVNNRKLSLVTYLPDRYDSASFPIDRPIRFLAVAIPQVLADKMPTTEKKYTTKQLDQLGVSYVKLELVPRGVGRVLVRATNFYLEIVPREIAKMQFTVYNDGTRRLDNIRVRAEAPLNWASIVVPDIIPALLPGKEEPVAVELTPPVDVPIGDYEVTIKTDSYVNNRKVDAEDKKIRIHVAGSSNLLGKAALGVLILAILGGVAWFGIRLSRR